MSGSLPHYQKGPYSYQAATLILGGQLVVPSGANALTVTPCVTSGALNVLGVAVTDTQPFPNQAGVLTGYNQPIVDMSEPFDYVAVMHGVDTHVVYEAACNFGALLMSAATAGNVKTWDAATPSTIIGRCTQPGGVLAGATVARAWIN